MAGKVNLEKLARSATVPFVPHDVAEIGDYHAFVVTFEGTFPWHDHDEDELFLILDGELRVEFRGDRPATTLGPMDALLVEAGAAHQTVAPRRARALVFEKRAVTERTLQGRD